MAERGLDVVVVSDFEGSARELFEARTLLFLGSWLEHQGPSRDWPLHLVAIGSPPPAVADLARRSGARLVCRERVDPENRFLNKLRGLEIESRTGRILLLDADTLVLGDLSPAAALGDCFSALVAPGNSLPLAVFEEVYAAAGVELPAERVLPLLGLLERELPPRERRPLHRQAIPPYFNSGVVLAPAGSSLRGQWERVQRLLQARYAGRGKAFKALWGGDQHSLAVAVAILRGEGVAYRALPYALHGLDVLFAAGALRYEETRIFHAKRLFRLGPQGEALDPAREIELFWGDQVPRLYPEGPLARARQSLGRERIPSGADSLARLCQRLRELTARHVVPALQEKRPASAYST